MTLFICYHLLYLSNCCLLKITVGYFNMHHLCDLKNCRPVSNLLLFLSKLLERMVQTRLLAHLNANNLLPVWQSAYRRFHSTKTTVTKVFNDLLMAVDRGRYLSSASLIYQLLLIPLTTPAVATTRASCSSAWVAECSSIVSVRLDIPRRVRRRDVVHSLHYVLGSARLSFWSAVFHSTHGGSCRPGCQVRRVSSRLC